MGSCPEEDERHQTNNADDLKAAIKATWVPLHLSSAYKLIASMPRRIDAVIQQKEAQPNIEVHRNEHTFQKPDISVLNVIVYWFM